MKNLDWILNVLLALTVVPVLMAGAKIEPVTSTGADLAFPAFTNTGGILLTGREMMVDITYPSGKSGKGDLVILFDSTSGYFFARLGRLAGTDRALVLANDLRSSSRVYESSDGLILFTVRTPLLFISDSQQKASSIDDAQTKALKQATDELGDLEAERFKGTTIVLRDIPGLGGDFLAPKFSAVYGPVKPISVSQSAAIWEITIQGQWKAVVRLDSKYRVIDASRSN
jgi:hypothetical protein